MKKVFLLFSAITIIVICFIVYLALNIYFYQAPQTTIVHFPKGTATKYIANELHEHQLIKSKRAFILYVYLQMKAGKFLQSGEYEIISGQNTASIIHQLTAGKRYTRKFTIPEGLTNFQIDEIIKTSEGLMGDASASMFEEGSLMPDTYYYFYDDTRSMIIKTMIEHMETFINDNSSKNRNPGILKTKSDILTLASIIERETPKKEELPIVASVYINRLKMGMRLQADPTVEYALSSGTGIMGTVTLGDLKFKSPFNTYINPGLPPSPIAAPSRKAILAALEPADTKFIYFVADGTGGHKFATSYSEHLKNVESYRRLNITNISKK